MRTPRPQRGTSVRLGAGLLVLASITASLAGCTRSEEPRIPTPSTSASVELTPLVAGALEPVTLLPADIRDPYGDRIARLLYRGLYRFDAKGKSVPEVAESVETTDDTVFTVKLHKDWVFANGDPVTARSFVDAWNFAARPASKQLHAAAYSAILGYADVRGSRTRPATSTIMRGLKVIDDLNFTITLSHAVPGFTSELGRLEFAPLSAAALKDPAATAKAPIGNGPYRMSGTWQPKKGLTVIPFTAYKGEDVARNPGVTFRFLQSLTGAYTELRNVSIDVLDYIPIAALPTYKEDLKLRAINQPVGITQSIAFPTDVSPWNTAAGLGIRQAISMAINRDELNTTIFRGTRTPATDLAAPVVDGHLADLCGATCTYDPAEAVATLKRATGFSGILQIAYAADGDDKAWIDAVCRSVTKTLAVACMGVPYATQAALSAAVTAKTIETPFVSTTTMDTPDLGAFVSPRFLAGTGENDTRYAVARTQSLLARAEAASADRLTAYQEVERSILKDLPVIPLWSVNVTGGSSERVQGLKMDVFGRPVYTEITLS
jgi:oligopeptide transport system substrate-binding protein